MLKFLLWKPVVFILKTLMNTLIRDYFIILTVTEGLATAFSAVSPSESSGGEWRFINDKPYCSFCEKNKAHYNLI